LHESKGGQLTGISPGVTMSRTNLPRTCQRKALREKKSLPILKELETVLTER